MENDDKDDIDMEDILMTQDNGITLIKSLEEFMGQKHVIFATDVINLFLSIMIFLIYLARTYMMCKFDTNPIWRVPVTSDAPIFDGQTDLYGHYAKDANDWSGLYFEKDFDMEHYFPSEQCKGEL